MTRRRCARCPHPSAVAIATTGKMARERGDAKAEYAPPMQSRGAKWDRLEPASRAVLRHGNSVPANPPERTGLQRSATKPPKSRHSWAALRPHGPKPNSRLILASTVFSPATLDKVPHDPTASGRLRNAKLRTAEHYDRTDRGS